MASPAVALPNGVPTPIMMQQQQQQQQHQQHGDINAHSNTNANAASNNSNNLNPDVDMAQSINASTKRKRESSDAGDKQPNGLNYNGTPTPVDNNNSNNNNTTTIKVDKPTILKYYDALQTFDITPSILKRPLPDADSAVEPDTKRQKSEDGSSLPSIADKVAKEEYEDLDGFIDDIKTSTTHQIAELQDVDPEKDTVASDEALAKTIDFKLKAYGLFKRELTYPKPPQNLPAALRTLDATSDLQSNASGNMVLTVNGEATRGKQLYSSLQQPVVVADGEKPAIRPLRETGLPAGIKTAKAIPYSFASAVEKDKKSKTLGELFPAPRSLPSLQPPKAPKSTTKGVQVGWHRPELTEKSKYRAGSYFSQTISTGQWLDYSNAAPPSQIMTKQRERALSLAGNKPSSSDLEMSEMESLFRGAFSSFAPSKDDSAAMISSGMISHTMWWQKAGKRSFDRLIEAEYSEDAVEVDDEDDTTPIIEVDEEVIEDVIQNWDDSMIDPSLEDACCPKMSDEEKDVDAILQDVSDMIQTLVSYQRNRNVTLPTASAQSRYAADPAHSDMLTNGTPVQPGDEETATYQALKAQLVLVVQMLPPYAVARLNSDKLDELNISTKLEIRTDEYQGLMEEDETAARARAAQVASASARPVSHRSGSSSNSLHYGQQYHPNRAPIPSPQFYTTQTPVRPPQPAMQRPPQTMPAAYPQRPPSNTSYRPPNHYPNTGYSQQYAKPPSFSQPGAYGGTPTPARPYQPMPGYPNMGNPTPQARYPYTPTTQAPNYHQPYAQHTQHVPPTHAPYGQYTNGASPMPQRTASPHVPHQQPQHQPVPHQGYNPTATPSRQASYGGQPNMGNDPSRRFYPTATTPMTPTSQQHQQHTPQKQNQSNPGTSSFHTSLNPHQVQQAMDQAKARFDATQSAQRTNEGIRSSISGQGQGQGQVGAPVGLGGIGLGGDPARMAAARAGMPGPGPGGANYAASSQSPKPQPNSPALPPAVNGSPAPAPPQAVPIANGNGNGPPAPGKEA
ncbi:hypothetical protein F5B20DRAFT_540436 [Whalleya microplaca]|nr:hypothetical protein F5B20DRAFT_540436 [Whalleya microplaca]